ncbi:TPA: lanthionine synthetase C family protein [Enterococcus faecalis]|uniref:lanthionine synthetase C family protein n=1 Tax=Enterococcus faecalis TaxID=1351 RepID=UPI0001B2E72C|nr:lanthionine synthetase C family protein [Enterococcus faecalis]EEU79942.1 SpaC [Enterococcus faecalis Fly1]MDU1451445.1 lanthionine synthetase C family protein [Enterococcus faecalis]HBI1770651.1 lanthionine synthetase C family protein [Enterococcus faecalis]HBI1794102.1 lanthionine synthetase C family protein [Enterococcus faecalis]HBI1800798.1 lanthionine synthetase C family protein [Enterococcus faecalis]
MNEIDCYVKKIALKLKDFDYVERVLLEKDNYLNYGEDKIFPNSPLTMSHGIPGLCLLYAELDRQYPDEKWMDCCNLYVQKLVKMIKIHGIEEPSLFSGCSGICLAIVESSNNGRFYGKFKVSVDIFLKDLVQEKFKQIHSDENTMMFDYDTIQGLSGILNYMLIDTLNQKFFFQQIKDILNYFVKLSKKYKYKGIDVPYWRISSENLFLKEERALFPDGAINLGVSHGISGPLIVMSKAYESNVKVPGLKEAILSISELLTSSLDTKHNNWPSMIDIRKLNEPNTVFEESRDAWCYGRPGVAFAILKASQALKDKTLLKIACTTMESGIHSEIGLISPTFCHGYIGVSYIYKKFYESTKIDAFDQEAKRLMTEAISFYDEKLPFGFPNWEHNINDQNQQEMKMVNTIGILDGVTGILLSLLSMLGNKKTNWDAVFLLD